MSAPVLDAILDDLRVGLRRRASIRRRARAASTVTAAAALVALAVAGSGGTGTPGASTLAAGSGADASVLLRGCTGVSAGLACSDALPPSSRF